MTTQTLARSKPRSKQDRHADFCSSSRHSAGSGPRTDGAPRSLLGWVRAGLAGAALLAAIGLFPGCGSSSNGDLGIASFTVKNCGGSFADITGCDIKQLIATGGKIDMRAVRMSDNSPLQIRSDFPTVLSVTDLGGATYTLNALRPGKAMLIASSGSTDVDHVMMQVDDAAQIAFLTVSAEGGTFTAQPAGDIDGIFVLHDGITRMTLLFAQLDGVGNKMLGRETFTTTLSPGLAYQSGKESPTALQFDLLRPAQSGMYSLLIKHNIGPARYKMQINVP